MCGIAGVLRRNDDPHERTLTRMAARLAHRGPDDEGVLTVGPATLLHRRLSILDTSQAGHQPMCSEDGLLAILHNGEIYNFLELAEQLAAKGHRFTTSTDTEVILAAYREWGMDCFRRFNGIWAMALWDARDGALLLSRDPLGVKPLFVTEVSGDLYFASEIKALLEVPGVNTQPLAGAVRDFLVAGVVDHSDNSFYSGIRSIPAAHTLIASRSGRRLVRHWGPPELARDPGLRQRASDANLVEELRHHLLNAVALQVRSDVPLGSCLSGGLDSSTVVTYASALRDGRLSSDVRHRERDRPPQLAFFAEFREPGIDERPYVDDVTGAAGIELRTVTPTAADFAETLPVVLEQQDEPFASASIVAQYHVMRLASESGVKVLLDGQGADELFAGYPPFLAPYRGEALRQLEFGALRASRPHEPKDLLAAVRYAILGARRRPRWLGGSRTPPWLGETLERNPGLWREEAPPRGTILAQVLWQQLVGNGLPALLRYEDRNSMAFGIEARVPFLDIRLVDFALRLPDRLKIAGRRRKVVLQEAARGFVPESVLRRRDKIAFAPPQTRWMQEAASAFSEFTRDPRLEEAGYVRRGALATALRDVGFASKGANPFGSDVAFRLLIAEMWLRRRG